MSAAAFSKSGGRTTHLTGLANWWIVSPEQLFRNRCSALGIGELSRIGRSLSSGLAGAWVSEDRRRVKPLCGSSASLRPPTFAGESSSGDPPPSLRGSAFMAVSGAFGHKLRRVDQGETRIASFGFAPERRFRCLITMGSKPPPLVLCAGLPATP